MPAASLDPASLSPQTLGPQTLGRDSRSAASPAPAAARLVQAAVLAARLLPALLVAWWAASGLMGLPGLIALGFASLVWMTFMHCLEPMEPADTDA